MRRLPIALLAAVWTLGFVYVAHAAMVADLEHVGGRAPASAAAEPLWYGGTLPPVVVETPAGPGGEVATIPEACPTPERGVARAAAHRAPMLRSL